MGDTSSITTDPTAAAVRYCDQRAHHRHSGASDCLHHRRIAGCSSSIEDVMFALLVVLAVLLSGCIVVTERPAYYTRYEMDAINAEVACRSMARNMLQMERCSIRR